MSTLTAAERETVVNLTDDSRHVHIWTNQPRVLRTLRKRVGDDLVQYASGMYDGFEWAAFHVPVNRFNLASAVKHRRKGGFGGVKKQGDPITQGQDEGVSESRKQREIQTEIEVSA